MRCDVWNQPRVWTLISKAQRILHNLDFPARQYWVLHTIPLPSQVCFPSWDVIFWCFGGGYNQQKHLLVCSGFGSDRCFKTPRFASFPDSSSSLISQHCAQSGGSWVFWRPCRWKTWIVVVPSTGWVRVFAIKKRSAFRLKTDPLAWPSTPSVHVSNISDGLFYTHFYRSSSAGMRDCERHVRRIANVRCLAAGGRYMDECHALNPRLSCLCHRTMCILREKIWNIHNYNNILLLYTECVSAFTHELWKSVAVSTWALDRPLFKKCCKKNNMCYENVLTRSCVSFLLIYVEMFRLCCLYFSSSPLHFWKYQNRAEKRRFGNCTTCICKEALFIEIYMRCFMYESKEAQHLWFSHL